MVNIFLILALFLFGTSTPQPVCLRQIVIENVGQYNKPLTSIVFSTQPVKIDSGDIPYKVGIVLSVEDFNIIESAISDFDRKVPVKKVVYLPKYSYACGTYCIAIQDSCKPIRERYYTLPYSKAFFQLLLQEAKGFKPDVREEVIKRGNLVGTINTLTL